MVTHIIHGTGIFTYIYHTNQPNVGKYTSPMDGMGMGCINASLLIMDLKKNAPSFFEVD